MQTIVSNEAGNVNVIRPFRRAARRYCVSVRGRRCFVALAGGTSELCSISDDAPMCGSTPRRGLRPPPDEPSRSSLPSASSSQHHLGALVSHILCSVFRPYPTPTPPGRGHPAAHSSVSGMMTNSG